MTAVYTILTHEKELFVRLSQSDQIAFTQIFDHYEPRLYPFVLKITRSESITEEIIQELFIKLWTDRKKAADIEHPRSYIFRMATNRTANYLRGVVRNTIHINKATLNVPVSGNTTEETIDEKEVQQLITRAVEKLPTQQRTVYLLSRHSGLNAEEIAAQMNISPKTVKNHLTEALRFIKEQLKQSPGNAIALIIFLVKNTR